MRQYLLVQVDTSVVVVNDVSVAGNGVPTRINVDKHNDLLSDMSTRFFR